MNKYDFISALAPNKDIENTHYNTKLIHTLDELLWLLGSGFSDCSYGNDECPSYAITNEAFIKGVDPIVLMFHPLNDDGTLNTYPFSVGFYGIGEDWKSFKKISRAIAYYQQLNVKNIMGSIENYVY